jgi:biopolymer transport protein ExbB/TolQ
VSGSAAYALLYFGCLRYLEWPIQRLLGPISATGIPFSINNLLYLALYVLFFWGVMVVLYKGSLLRYEHRAHTGLEENFQSSTIIGKRTELDNLKASITQGQKGMHIRDTTLVQTLLFLIDHCLVTETSERVVEIFTRRMDTLQKQIESSYNILRYIAWAIPSVGFLGTVSGIGEALGNANLAMENLDFVVSPLRVAFDTTLIALVESIILMFLIYNMQHKEEDLLNSIDLF